MQNCVTVHEFIEIETPVIAVGEEWDYSDVNVSVFWALTFPVYYFRLLIAGALNFLLALAVRSWSVN